jgi:NAD(P)-dependent dehydrogenase (short-subunit alcohol dehydrogenase family)
MKTKKLEGKVALVAGATRGAGRGIATALGEAGATVYCSGRSTRKHAATPGRSETIEETAERVTAAGGRGIAVRTDHRDPAAVARLMARIEREQGGLDVLVNDIWGGDAWMDWWFKMTKFWKIPLEKGFDVLQTALHTHLITAWHAIPLLIARNQGRKRSRTRPLIVGITDGDGYYYRGQFYFDFVKTSVIRMAFALANELRRERIAAVALTPGFLRSESMLDIFGVTEANWRDGAKKRPEFLESESPLFVGRAVAALAADSHLMRKSGRVFNATELAEEYGFTDYDGRVPQIWKYLREEMPHFAYRKLDDVFYSYWGESNDAMEKELEAIAKDVTAAMERPAKKRSAN